MTSPIGLPCRRHAFRLRSFAAVLVVSVVTVGIVPANAATKAKAATEKKEKDAREMQAREAFAAGSYKEALDIYTKLYASKLHPTYLRNIGRCYQNLGEPDRAIASFREYLRKAKAVSLEERAEVDGYVKEMEELQRKNAVAAAPPAAPPAAPQPLPVAAPAPAAAPAASIVITQPSVPAPAPAPTPFYKRAWFWGVVGVVVVAGTVGGLWAGGVFSPADNNACADGVTCGGIGR